MVCVYALNEPDHQEGTARPDYHLRNRGADATGGLTWGRDVKSR